MLLAVCLAWLLTEMGVDEYVLPKWKKAKLSGMVSSSLSGVGVVYFLLLWLFTNAAAVNAV